MTQVDPGLANIIVANTYITEISGSEGRLSYRGTPVEALARTGDYESVAALLWDEPTGHVRHSLGQGRLAAWALLPTLGDALHQVDGMDALRASLAHLGANTDPVAATAVFVAAWARLQQGQDLLAPNPTLGHGEDFLRMVLGAADVAQSRALNRYLVAVMDHGFNASTFAARVVTSTGSDEVSAMVAAVGALKGPLHGGAPGPVLDMLDDIGTESRAEPWLQQRLDHRQRIMGMGHRVYRVRDPRAAVLEQALTLLPTTDRLTLAQSVERIATRLLGERHPDRPLRANVEFYTAVLLEAIGLPRTLFAPTFAVARCAGWRAHIREQREHGRLIRPKARYLATMGQA